MNANTEFLERTKDKNVVKAIVKYMELDSSDGGYERISKYTGKNKEEFLSKLDFDYDDEYGDQEFFGFIWYKDGTWPERGEYDESEWWRHFVRPDPKKVMQ